MSESRYLRNEGLFGREGQERLRNTTVGQVGYGGVGSILGPELAYLGVTRHRVVEFDLVEESNLNRLAGAVPGDEGSEKVAIAQRTLSAIQPGGDLRTSPHRFGKGDSLDVLADVDVLFGCVDSDPVRLALLEWASERRITYVDLATDVIVEDGQVGAYGGRVSVMTGLGCLACLKELDQEDLRIANMTDDQRNIHQRIYGIARSELSRSGPSVITLNAVIASLAATEFMVMKTGLRPAIGLLHYGAHTGGVRPDRTPPPVNCAYCARYRRPGDETDRQPT